MPTTSATPPSQHGWHRWACALASTRYWPICCWHPASPNKRWRSAASSPRAASAQDLLRREADAKDGRIKRLSLTKTGTALAEQTLAIQNEIIGHMTAPLSDQELSGLTELSERVVAQLEALLDP